MSISNAHVKKLRLFAAQKGLCCYCNRPIFLVGQTRIKDFAAQYGLTRYQAGRRRATIEHLRRKADGGLGTWDNIALACEPCNHSRGERSWVEHKTLQLVKYAPEV